MRCSVVLASVGVLAAFFAVPVRSEEPGIAALTRADQAYNAKWDRCDVLASKRGTPPGSPGYGDFIRDCVGNYPAADSRPPTTEGRATDGRRRPSSDGRK